MDGLEVEEADRLRLSALAQQAFERVLETGGAKDLAAATNAIYAAAATVVQERGALKDPVVLAFLIELSRKISQIEARVGKLLEPPKPT